MAHYSRDNVRAGMTWCWLLLLSVAVMASAHTAAFAGAPSDTALRAAFCIGMLNKSIAEASRAPVPLYITPDGRDVTPPTTARAYQQYLVNTVRELTYKRERLQRFLLPLVTDADVLLPLGAAEAEGEKLFEACANGTSTDACSRLRPCSGLEWMPY